MVFSPAQFRCHRFILFLFMIQISYVLLWIVSTHAMDLALLLGISETSEQPLFLLVRLFSVPVISSVDLAVFLLLLLQRPLATGVKESGSGLRSLDAYISYRQQISHNFLLLLLDGLDVGDPVVEDIHNLDILHVGNSITDITETFHVIPDAFIMLLLDGF
jgi:hypothetical protein